MRWKTYIKIAIVTLLLISSVTLLPTTFGKTIVSNTIAKKIHFNPHSYNKISINLQKIMDDLRELVKNRVFRKDVRNIYRYLVEKDVRNTVEKLLENKIDTNTFQEKISGLLSNSAVKTFFDKYGKSLDGSILVAIVVVGIIIAAVWGGALGGFLGSILLPGVGTTVGAIIGAVASGWIAFLSVIPAALWTEGHLGFLPDIVKSVITAILVAVWPIFWIIFLIDMII